LILSETGSIIVSAFREGVPGFLRALEAFVESGLSLAQKGECAMRPPRRTAAKRRNTKAARAPRSRKPLTRRRKKTATAVKSPHSQATRTRPTLSEWEASFNAVTEPISFHDRNFRVTRVNNAFAALLGAPAATFVGRRCYEIIHGSARPWDQCPHEAVLKTGKPRVEEFFEPNLDMMTSVKRRLASAFVVG
jgi:PAS domain-containing protein